MPTATIKSRAQRDALAHLLRYGPALAPVSGRCEIAATPGTCRALLAKGWIEERQDPADGPWGIRYHLTETGRAVALAL